MVWIVAAMAFWNVAGYYDDPDTFFGRNECWAYGWPETYLRRSIQWYDAQGGVIENPRFEEEGKLRWQDSLTLVPWHRAVEFRPEILALDAAIGASAILGVGASFEWWRRRRHHLFQLHLSDLLVVVGVVGVGLAWGKQALNSREYAEKAAENLREKQRLIVVQGHGTPECIRILLPGDTWKLGDYVRCARTTFGKWSKEDVRAIVVQRRLEHLDLFNIRIAPEGWSELAKTRSLRSLSLRDNSVGERQLILGDVGFAAISQIPNLRRIQFDVPDLTDDSLRFLAGSKRLRELVIRNSMDSPSLTNEGLKHIAAIPSLSQLELDSSRVRDDEFIASDLTPLAKCRRLRRLSIVGKNLSMADVETIAQLSGLEQLALVNCTIRKIPDQAAIFPRHRGLKRLDFDLYPTSDSLWNSLQRLPDLKELHVGGVGDEGLEYACRVRTLRRLSYADQHFTNEGLKSLANLPRLEYLCLGASLQLTDEAMDSLVGLKSLREINFASCDQITDAGLQRLAHARPDLKITKKWECAPW